MHEGVDDEPKSFVDDKKKRGEEGEPLLLLPFPFFPLSLLLILMGINRFLFLPLVNIEVQPQ